MPYSVIDSPKKYFEVKTYTGNGSSQSIGGLSFSPDFVWVKDRTSANSHNLSDIVRGATKTLFTDATNAEVTDATRLTSFNSDGFSVGSSGSWNTNTNNYVSWNWDANGAGVSNTQGSITSTVSANTTSGFSIVSYTGTGATATIGHGLGVAPKMIIVKQRSAIRDWVVGHSGIGWTKYLYLNSTQASAIGNFFNDTTPSSTVFNVVNDGGVNASSGTYIAYCFAEVKGFSKAFSYTGNGSADGVFVHLGFKPAFIMIKASSTTGNWFMQDITRNNNFNGDPKTLQANSTSSESTIGTWGIDLLSNGFKVRESNVGVNGSGSTYIGIAFASNPFVSSKGIPTTAR